MTHVTGTTVVGDQDVYFFREGTHTRLYDILGCRLDPAGASFGVWAPSARAVSVIGEFNGWDGAATPLHPRGDELIYVAGLGADVRLLDDEDTPRVLLDWRPDPSLLDG